MWCSFAFIEDAKIGFFFDAVGEAFLGRLSAFGFEVNIESFCFLKTQNKRYFGLYKHAVL